MKDAPENPFADSYTDQDAAKLFRCFEQENAANLFSRRYLPLPAARPKGYRKKDGNHGHDNPPCVFFVQLTSAISPFWPFVR
jgi:hypothetical protein